MKKVLQLIDRLSFPLHRKMIAEKLHRLTPDEDETLARIRVHQILGLDTDDIDYHYELISVAEWPQDNGQGKMISSDSPEVEARLEIAEDLAYSIPEPGILLTLYVDTSFGFAGLHFDSNEEIAVEMARHVLLCTHGCKHQSHTSLAL